METTWMAKGNCADRDPKIFFPSDGIGVARAKSICSTCPVQAACLEHALTHRIDPVSYTHLTLPTMFEV